MKRSVVAILATLAVVMMFSFSTKNNENLIKIQVQADKPVEFDMLKDGRLTRSLMTPYQLTIDEKDSKMIFKSRQEKSVLKIKVDSKNSSLSSDWPLTVVLIEEGKLSSFGMF